MILTTKEFHFSAAHRIEGHPKCGRLHGHNYKVVVTVGVVNMLALDDMGFTLDFGLLGEVVKPIIDELDHRYMVSGENDRAGCPYYEVAPEDDVIRLPVQQTSAEILALYLRERIENDLRLNGYDVMVTEVQVWETPKAYASC